MFDLVICGGGLVGASLAAALRQSKLKIAIIEPKEASHTIHHPDTVTRALALSYFSVDFLKTMGAWERVSSHSTPIQKIHVSKKRYFGVCEIAAKTFGLPFLGYVVDAVHLESALSAHIQSDQNIDFFYGDSIVSFGRELEGWQFKLQSGRCIQAKLLVGADGTNSIVRKRVGIGVRDTNHLQSALVTNIEISDEHHEVAFERFLEQGTVAMLPLALQKVKCVWIAHHDSIKDLYALPENTFLEKLQAAFGYRLGTLLSIEKPAIYTLKTVVADALYAERSVLIGNAANTMHPVGAQGFNLGLRDAVILAETLLEYTGKDVGEKSLLRAYAEKRVVQQQRTIQFTQHLIYPNILQWLGILSAEYIPGFKKCLGDIGLGKF